MISYHYCLYCKILQEGEPEAGPSQLNRVSVEELLEQLQITQTELENVRVSNNCFYLIIWNVSLI